MSEQYTYAVARIRALEVSLFSDQTIDQLIACGTYRQCLQFLEERGWGDPGAEPSAEAILAREEEKIWEVVKDLHISMDKFDVLSLPKQFHNLKAAVKTAATGKMVADIFYSGTAISGEELLDRSSRKAWDELPDMMREAAHEAFDTLLHTGDGQLCDILIDRACLDAIHRAGEAAKEQMIRDYAESTVAVADIRTAVRGQKTGKSAEFLSRAIAPCGTLDEGKLVRAAVTGEEALRDYLAETDYAGGGEALAQSDSAFERWCDNRMIETISPQKYNAFTIGPVIAWVIARQNEIKTVRIILSGKQNGLPEDSIRERVRKMYG